MSAFHAQNPTQTCVWHGQKRSPHHTKNLKEEGSPVFLVWWPEVFEFWARKADILFCYGSIHEIPWATLGGGVLSKIITSWSESDRGGRGGGNFHEIFYSEHIYDIFRQENWAKNREKAAKSQKRRFQKAWFRVPAIIFECSKTKTGGFSAGLIFTTFTVSQPAAQSWIN